MARASPAARLTIALSWLSPAAAWAAADPPDPRAYDGPTAIIASTTAPPVVVADGSAPEPEVTDAAAPDASTPAPAGTIDPPRVRPPTSRRPGELPTRAVEPARAVRMRPAIDLAITLGAAAPSLALGLWITPSLPGPVVVPGPGDTVGRFDRVALGRFSDRADTAADALLGVTVGMPVVVHVIEAALYRRGFSTARGRGFISRFGTDLVLYGQALAINGLLTQILKAAVRRPRPYAYMDPAEIEDPQRRAELIAAQADHDADWSFPSGHASTAFAASSAGATLLTLELLGRSKWGIALAWIGGMGLATATSTMRVLGGRHFPSDTVTSALLGTAVGVIVPLAHWRPTPWGDIADRKRPGRWMMGAMTGRGLAGLQLAAVFP